MASDRHVHLVVQEATVQEDIALLLRSAAFEVETYDSGLAFMDRLAVAQVGCVLLNIHLPGIDGLEVLRRMNFAGSKLPVIILDGHDLPLAVEAIKAGAAGFLEKPYDRETILAALEDGFERLDTGTFEHAARDAAVEAVARLTPREREVMQGLLAGHGNKLIARNLDVSHRTVELHRSNLMEKLGAKGLSGAVRIAIAAGLTPAE